MIKYWGNFIRKGDPNSSGLPTWSPRLHDSDVMQLVPEALGKSADVNAGHSCGAEQISRGMFGKRIPEVAGRSLSKIHSVAHTIYHFSPIAQSVDQQIA